MIDNNPQQVNRVLYFEKLFNETKLNCLIEEFKDGSVFVANDDYEMVFEFTEDALVKAIKHVTAEGYKQVYPD